MTYTGHVTVGGPAAARELPLLAITKVAVGPYNNNSYLLRCEVTGEQLLIDAAAEPERLLSLIGPDGIGMVVTTHAHPARISIGRTESQDVSHPSASR